MNLNNGYEIERKFLIEFPNIELLKAQEGCSFAKLSQCYLNGGTRIRSIEKNGETKYIKTVKQHVSDIKRIENESEITGKEFLDLLKNKKQGTNIIEKTRYFIPFKNHTLEIDVFPFWNDRAFLEIELNDENEEFFIPDYLKVIKEVTFDKRYRNSALAKEIITEEL